MTDLPDEQPPTNLAAALALVQSQLPHIKKDQTANVRSDKGNYSYSYADLAAVTAEILPLLGRSGLAWVTRPMFNAEGRFMLVYELLHTSGERIGGEYPLPNSGTPQAMGSAITYARRYTLCSVTGVAPESDDDDAAHATEQARPRQTVQRQRQERPAERPPRGGWPPVIDDPKVAASLMDEPQAQQGVRTRVQRNTRQGPPLPGEDRPRRPDEVTPPQLAKLGAVFTSLGVKGDGARAERLRISSAIVGRDLETSKDLTKDEARTLIDTLEGATAETLAELTAPPAAPDEQPRPGEVDADPDAATQEDIEAEVDELFEDAEAYESEDEER
jgi:ERF superfamily